jgi:hypothetical protein
MNDELKQHINILERSNDEHKRAARKREKDFDQIKTEYEHNLQTLTTLSHKVTSFHLTLI